MTITVAICILLFALLIILPVIVAGLAALAVIVSFAIAWYEHSNRAPATVAQRQYPLALRLLVTEFASLVLTFALRPLGWLPPRFPTGPSRRPPVILLHGLFQNRSSLLPLGWRLRAAGFDCIVSINTPPWLDLETLTDRLQQAVIRVRAATGAAQVHLVGHSLGGIIARNYLLRPGTKALVAGCVTLASPHRGSKLAPFAITRLGRTLLPGSALLTRLNAAPPPAGVRFSAIYSRHDNIVLPMDNARLDGAANVELTGLGHTALLFSSKTAEAVVAALEA